MFGNYFGLLQLNDPLKNNILFLPFLVLLLILFFWQWKKSKGKYFKSYLLSTSIMFFLFLLVVEITGSRLFYPRTSIPIIFAFYILIADSFNQVKYSKKIVYIIILIQLSQFIFYFLPNKNFSIKYDFFYYHENPIAYFAKYPFNKNSCLLAIPGWNKLAVEYYYANKLKIITLDDFKYKRFWELDSCAQMYAISQKNVKRDAVDWEFLEISKNNYELFLIENYDGQDFYLLKNVKECL
jgi:hypothetical protein